MRKWEFRMRHQTFLITFFLLILVVPGCLSNNKISLIGRFPTPLQEIQLGGKGENKLLVIPMEGVVSSVDPAGFARMFGQMNMVADVRAQLDLASYDPAIKAVVLKINSPGGSVTASDVLYTMIKRFKEQTGIKVLVLMMDVCASGGVYVSSAADWIMAHPTSITGSIGVIFHQLNFSGLMWKIGLDDNSIISGPFKDMGNPFRPQRADERELFQQMIDELYAKFVEAVAQGRPQLDVEQVRELADGRIYTAPQALEAKLVDEIGYFEDILAAANKLTDSESLRVVIYRRGEIYNDNVYISKALAPVGETESPQGGVERAWEELLRTWKNSATPGFYYLWKGGVSGW